MYRGEREITEDQYNETLQLSVVFPGILHLDLTNHCNKACDMCFMKDRYTEDIFPLGYMKFDLYKRIIDEALIRYPGQMEIHLYKDGESLLHPDLGEFVSYANSRMMYTHLATNGITLYERRKDVMGLDLLTISMIDDSAFEDVEKFMEARGPDKKPFTQIKIFEEHDWHKDIKLPKVDRILKRKIIKNIFSDKPRPDLNLCPHVCFNPAITWDGLFTLCCSDWPRKAVIGSLADDDIKTLWRVVRYIKELQIKGIFLPPCDKCTMSAQMLKI